MKRKKSRGGASLISPRKRILLIILILVLGIFIVKGIKLLKSKKYEYESKITFVEELKDELESEKNKKNTEEVLDNKTITDEDYESLAREELGLIKKDEIIIKPR